MLYFIATPIGNLKDLSFRALETLSSVDYILCEDTRTSSVLLKYYKIHKPLKSFHKFNEKSFEDHVIRDLENGTSIALISDAGTPGINDPGGRLAKRCQEEGLPYSAIPGACSPILALTLSGFLVDRFQFIGFLPKKEGEKKKALLDALFYPGQTVFFESPHRIHSTLQEIATLAPKQRVAIVREMTKVHEEVLTGRAEELVDSDIRGELVVVFEGSASFDENLEPKKLVQHLMETFDLIRPEAIKMAAHLLGIPKKQIYW